MLVFVYIMVALPSFVAPGHNIVMCAETDSFGCSGIDQGVLSKKWIRCTMYYIKMTHVMSSEQIVVYTKNG